MDRIHPMLEEYIRIKKYEYLDHGSTIDGSDFAIVKIRNKYTIIYLHYRVKKISPVNTIEDLARMFKYSENIKNAIQRIKDKQFHKDLQRSLK